MGPEETATTGRAEDGTTASSDNFKTPRERGLEAAN
jgi:hypothetical protein